MKKTTYIFDLDGTLLDTLQDLAAAVNFALRKNGMEEHSIDDIRRFVGNGVRKLIERAVPDGSKNPRIDEVFADFRSYYMQHSLDATKPYDGITEILQELKQRGCKMAVVSNKMMAATQELVAHFFPEIEVAIGENEAEGIRKKPAPDMVFEALHRLGAEAESAVYIGENEAEGIRKKPAPDMVFEALNRLGAEAESAVYIGDSDVDIQTAKNAGVPCISVLWGFRNREFLLEHGAQHFIEKPSEIIGV